MAVLKSTKLMLKKDGSVDAVRKYLSTTREYYAQEGLSLDGSPILPDAEWLDSPAVAALGLSDPGRKQDDDFARLLAGYNPRTGEALVQNAGEAGRCMAVDLTFSPRKEYSLAFIAASPQQRAQMTQAFHDARDKALALISGGLNSRTGKGGHRHVAVDGLLVRAVDHIDSRNGDPQWHCHTVVANVARCADGKWRSVDMRDLMRTTGSLQEAAQEVFARELAEGFMAMGFGIERQRILDEDERDTGKVANRIVGVDQATCEAFSTRRKEIQDGLAKAAAEGRTTDATEVAKATRQAKHMSASEVLVDARTRLEELAALTPGHFVKASDLVGKDSVALAKEKDVAMWFDELHAMDSHWNRSGLIAKLARELPLGTGIDIPAEADRLLAEWEANGTIIRLRDDPDLQQARWCSRDQWFLETTVLPAAKKRADEQAIRLDREAVALAIEAHEATMSEKLGKAVQLSDEQKASVLHVACDTGGLACIIGQAGTGKSASAGAYVRAFKAAGRRVIGTSTSQAATDNLRNEAQIEGKNTAELLYALDKGTLTLTADDVIVLDEAGMVGAKTFRRIQKHVDAVGAKLIAVGDPKQLEAIEAGGPFAQLCENFGAAAITQIMRQRNVEERALAESFYDENKAGADIVEEMLAKGMLRQDKHQVKALAQAYLADERSAQDKLIVVHTHADASAVDQYVRAGLKDSGALHAGASKTLTLGSGQYARELEVCLGERIRFQKNDRKDKDGKRRWNNNDIGTVVGFKRATSKRGLVLVIQMDEDGRRVEVDTDAFQRFGYAYARTAHSAQGLGAESVYWLARGGMIDRNAGLVAMTRTKSNFHAFASPEEIGRLATALDAWGKKETVIELARRKNAPAVARATQQPLVASTVAPVATEDVAQIKQEIAENARQHAEEIRRAQHDFPQAMAQWKAICDEERGKTLAELDLLVQPGGDIDLFNRLADDEDPFMRRSLEKNYKKAALRQARLQRRLEVLNPSSDADRTAAGQELAAWLDKFYIGGSDAARHDRRLRTQDPDAKAPTFGDRARARVAVVRARERAMEVAIASGVPREKALQRTAKVAELQSFYDELQGRRRAPQPGDEAARAEEQLRRIAQRRYDRANAGWNRGRNEERARVELALAGEASGTRRKALRERLDVLAGATPKHAQVVRDEKRAWLAKHYPGGAEAAVTDKRLLDEVAAKKQGQTVVLGQDIATPLDEVDWATSRFPQRTSTRVESEQMPRPGRNVVPVPRRRPGMLPTHPSLPTVPAPPRPRGWDQEI